MRRIDAEFMMDAMAPFLPKHTLCGWYRRGNSEGEKLEIVVENNDFADTSKFRSTLRAQYLGKCSSMLGNSYLIQNRIVNFYPAISDYWGAAVLYLTGNRLLIRILRQKCKELGFKLNPNGLFHAQELVGGMSERQIFYMLDIEYIPPEERNWKYGMYLKSNLSDVLPREYQTID